MSSHRAALAIYTPVVMEAVAIAMTPLRTVMFGFKELSHAVWSETALGIRFCLFRRISDSVIVCQ